MLQKIGPCGKFYRGTLAAQTLTVFHHAPCPCNLLTRDRERVVCTQLARSRLSLLTLYRASKFNVTLPFILRQAAWLYERQLSQVRAQMRKVGRSNAPSPAQGIGRTTGGQEARRPGSSEGAQNQDASRQSKLTGSAASAPSSTSRQNRYQQSPAPDASLPGTPKGKGLDVSTWLSSPS